MKHNSPGSEIRRRFRKNFPAVFGLFIIVIFTLLGVFCYLIMPDKTPFANRMDLALSNLPPGTSVELLKMPKADVQQSGWIESAFRGSPDEYDFIPVTSWKLQNDSVAFTLFTGDEDGPQQVLPLHSFKGNGQEIAETRVFLFGTDRFGRDMLSRLIAGTRVTLGVGLVAVCISLFIGILLGSLAGYFRGWVDQFVVWLINVIWSIPTLLLVIAITLVLGKGFEKVFIAVGLTMWVDVARIVRGQFFFVRELEYVSAGKALGFNNLRIIVKHMLPNIVGPVLVVAAANFSTAILLESGLSFLGIGAQPPVPSWGAMIKEYYGYIIIPATAYLAILPGLAIMLLTMAFTFVANGLRDAMDSRTMVSLS